jgi:hypothetical protein
MTIIAHFRAFNAPTLLGDLLVSGNTQPVRPVDIPASRSINERIFLPPNLYVAGLRQKVVLINETLAVAWAGDFMQAVDFFSSLEPLRHLSNVDAPYVRSIIDGIDDSRKDELHLIAIVAAGNDAALITHRASLPQEFGPISRIVCAGSGSDPFLEILKQHAENALEPNLGAHVDEHRKGFDLNLISALSGEEFASPLPLQKGWGGAFEVVRVVAGKVSKVPNLLFLNFFVRDEGSEHSLWWVPNFRHLGYWDHLTIVQAIEHEIGAGGDFKTGRNDVFIVGPPGSDSVNTSGFARPSLDQQDAVLTYVLLPNGERASTYAAAYEKPVFRYDISGAKLTTSFDRMFMDDLVNGLEKMLERRIFFRGAQNRPG